MRGVLLHGPPGTGKTSLALSCAHDAGVNLFSVNGREITDQKRGDGVEALLDIFDIASQAAPAVVSFLPPFLIFIVMFTFESAFLFVRNQGALIY